MNNTAARLRQGFTIIEIVVALFIVGLIVGAVSLGVFRYLDVAKRKTTENELRTIKSAIEMYNMTLNEYPKSLEDLITKPADEQIAARGWIKFLDVDRMPKDPWGREYIYQPTPGSDHDFELYSEGPDKKTKIDIWAIGR